MSAIPEEGIPAIPEKYRDVIGALTTRMLSDMEDEAAWTYHSEKHGVKAYTKIDGSLTAARGVGHVPYNPRAVWDLIMDVDRKHTYDAQLRLGKRAAVLDAQTNIDYLEYKGMFIVSGRDFVSLVHWRVLTGGTIVIVAKSVEDLDLCPLNEPKLVRGDVHIAGWKIVPDADYKGCKVTFMVKTDLKGSIPSRVAGKAAADQPYLIHELSQVLKKSKDLARYDTLGKVTNTIFEQKSDAAASSETA